MALVIKSKWKRPSEFPCFSKVRKRRARRRDSSIVHNIRFYLQICVAMRRADFNGVRALCAPVPTLRKLITVMSEKVPKHSHRWTVGVTAKDAQPAQCSSASGLVASEDPISGKEEVHAKRCGKECGTKIPGFHHCNRQEPEAAIDIERESGWEQRSQNVFRHCIRKHQRCSQLGFDRHSMSSEQVQQSS